MMKPVLLVWALAALSTVPALGAPPGKGKGKGDAVISQDAIEGETPVSGGDRVEYTTFNGIKVPPMKDIEGDKFADTIKEGYWYENHPSCWISD
jgi:hypothetical protein